MELRHLRYLIAVAEELHFGRAAIRLNISQPPLSQQIRQLEKELGVRLFDRNKRAVRLTDAGRRLVTEAQAVLGRVQHLVSVAGRAGTGEIGHLAIGVPGGVNRVLLEALRRLGTHFPGVHVELRYLHTGAQLEALRERQISAGFVFLPIQTAGLRVEVTQREPLWLALPRGHVLSRLKRIPIASLSRHRVILFPRSVTPGLHDTITGLCRDAGFTLPVAHEVDTIVGALTMVSAGLGVAFCTPSVRKPWPNIDFRPLREGTPVEQAVVYRHDGVSPALEAFLQLVREAANKRHRDPR